MSVKKCVIRRINEYNSVKGGIYAFINVLEKTVYVGETGNGEQRELTHIMNIFKPNDNRNGNGFVFRNQENSYYLMYLSTFEKNDNKDSGKFWITLETMYMYFFVKNGFKLYNMKKGRDNVGKSRAFLIENYNKGDLDKKFSEYLEERVEPNLICIKDKEYIFKTWDDLVKYAENIFYQDIIDVFGQNIFMINEPKELVKLWENFLNEKKTDSNYIVMENSNDFYVFNKMRLQKLQNKNKRHYFSEINFKTLINNSQMDFIIFSKLGDYLTETVYEILENKVKDLNAEINPFDSDDEFGVCFWSISGNQQRWIRDKLEYITKSNGQKEIYMILSYTGSKSLSMRDGAKATRIGLNRKRNGIIINDKAYPKEFTTAKIGHRKNMAFVISDFYYPKETISVESIERNYKPIFECDEKNTKLLNECMNQKPFYLAKLTDSKSLLSDINDTSNNNTRIIIAKLKYPYIVAISS